MNDIIFNGLFLIYGNSLSLSEMSYIKINNKIDGFITVAHR